LKIGTFTATPSSLPSNLVPQVENMTDWQYQTNLSTY
jgi:hypothetical protein